MEMTTGEARMDNTGPRAYRQIAKSNTIPKSALFLLKKRDLDNTYE